jgi:hypothetical protein
MNTYLLVALAGIAVIITGFQPTGEVKYPDACYQDGNECHVDGGEIILEQN